MQFNEEDVGKKVEVYYDQGGLQRIGTIEKISKREVRLDDGSRWTRSFGNMIGASTYSRSGIKLIKSNEDLKKAMDTIERQKLLFFFRKRCDWDGLSTEKLRKMREIASKSKPMEDKS